MIDEEAGKRLLAMARRSLTTYVRQQQIYRLHVELLPPVLQVPGSSFVTLMSGSRLRGCIGSTDAEYPLAQDVIRNAAAAARDPRFTAVTPSELEDIRLEVSVLQPARPLGYVDEQDLRRKLRPGLDGVIVSWQERRALLLPQVWDRVPDPSQFLRALCEKARIPLDELKATPPTVTVRTFESASFEEDGYYAEV